MTQRQRIEDLPTPYLICRATQHLWKWLTDGLPKANAGFYYVDSVCIRCEMQKTEVVRVRTGDTEQTLYSHRPHNFGSGEVGNPYTKQDCKKELIRRRKLGLVRNLLPPISQD